MPIFVDKEKVESDLPWTKQVICWVFSILFYYIWFCYLIVLYY